MGVLSSQFSSFRVFLFYTLFCVLIFYAFVPLAEAASLSVRPKAGEYKLGEEFRAVVELDPEGQPISGVDAIMEFDPSILFVIGLDSGDSVLDQWEAEPNFSNNEGTVSFNGEAENPLRVNSTLLYVDFRVVGYGESKLSPAQVLLTTPDDEVLDVLVNSLGASYTITKNKPYAYTTITTVSADDLLPGIFSEAVILNLGLLIVLLIFLGHLAYVHRQFKVRELRLRRETAEVHEQLTKIFSALRDEIYDQIRSITKRTKLSKNESSAVAGLNQALEVSETLISKEIDDVKNLLN